MWKFKVDCTFQPLSLSISHIADYLHPYDQTIHQASKVHHVTNKLAGRFVILILP